MSKKPKAAKVLNVFVKSPVAKGRKTPSARLKVFT